jgi:hypothetical protein
VIIPLFHSNFTGEKRNLFNGENKTDLYTSFKNGTSSSIPLPSLNSPGRHRPESGNTSKRNELNISSQSRKENHRPNSSNTVKKMFQSSILSEKEELVTTTLCGLLCPRVKWRPVGNDKQAELLLLFKLPNFPPFFVLLNWFLLVFNWLVTENCGR